MAGAIWSTDNTDADLVEVDFTRPWELSDVAFLMDDGKKVFASKTIFAMWSPVMMAMLFHDFKEKSSKEIKLPGKRSDEILELVKVLHPPNKDLDANNVVVILPLAREYQMEELTKRCERFLLDRAPSVLSLVMAEEFSLMQLQDRCMAYIQHTRLTDLTREPAFQELSNETKVKILLEKSTRYERILSEMQRIAEGSKPDQMRFRIGGTLCTYMCPEKDRQNRTPHNAGTERNCKSCAVSMMTRIWERLHELEAEGCRGAEMRLSLSD